MIQFGQGYLKLLLATVDTNRRQHFGMSDKDRRHELFHIIATAIVQNDSNIDINDILIPQGNVGTVLLEQSHGTLALFRKYCIVLFAKEFHQRRNNPDRKLLHIFRPCLGIQRHGLHLFGVNIHILFLNRTDERCDTIKEKRPRTCSAEPGPLSTGVRYDGTFGPTDT